MSRTDMHKEMTPEQARVFMESSLKSQIAMLKREIDPSLPPVTYTDSKGDTHELDGFVSLIHTRTGNLFQGYHLTSGKLFSLLDTVIGSLVERDPDAVRSFLSQMIMEHFPDAVSAKTKRQYDMLKKLTEFVELADADEDDDSKTNEGETK